MNRSGTPIAWPLQVWFVVEVLFGVSAVLTIALADQVNFANVALFGGYTITLIAFALGIYLVRGDWRRALR